MAGRKEHERTQRRENLLEAAARVFGRKPFDEATMQEVAVASEICLQQLYEHFPSKQDLYEAVMIHRAEIFRVKADTALAKASRAPIERLKVLAKVYVQQFQDRPFALPMFVRDRAQFDFGFDSRFRQRYQEVYQAERHRLRAILQEAVALGALRPLDPEFLTQLCLDVLQSSLHHSLMKPSGEEGDLCATRALDCLFQGIGIRL